MRKEAAELRTCHATKARGNMLRALSIKVQAGLIGGNSPIHCVVVCRGGKRGQCTLLDFPKILIFKQQRFPCKRRGENNTLHRAHLAYAIFSRVWLKILVAQCSLCNMKQIVRPLEELFVSRIRFHSHSSLQDLPLFSHRQLVTYPPSTT